MELDTLINYCNDILYGTLTFLTVHRIRNFLHSSGFAPNDTVTLRVLLQICIVVNPDIIAFILQYLCFYIAITMLLPPNNIAFTS